MTINAVEEYCVFNPLKHGQDGRQDQGGLLRVILVPSLQEPMSFIRTSRFRDWGCFRYEYMNFEDILYLQTYRSTRSMQKGREKKNAKIQSYRENRSLSYFFFHWMDGEGALCVSS